MSDKLTEICDVKREHVARRKAAVAETALLAQIDAIPKPRGFAKALQAKVDAGGYALITEIKKASPSAGLIRPDFDPAKLAAAYEAGGAACLSVLTDVPYFQGQDTYLGEARGACSLPALRKDFMVDPYQIAESRTLGADCILIIMAALDDALAKDMEDAAFDLGMDVLIEVHDEAETERALKVLKSPLMGVNNRNLKTLKIDLANTERLSALIPNDRVLVCESGLHARSDLKRMERVGAKRFLIGESLMRQDDVTTATRALLKD